MNSARRMFPAVVCLCLSFLPLAAREKPKADPRLAQIASIFVAGNNQAAEKARETLSNGKTCFALATKASDADAVLDLSADSQTSGGMLGSMGSREWVVSATLTLKSGDLVWSKSLRWGDEPFKSGAKTAGDLLVRDLSREANCKARSSAAGK